MIAPALWNGYPLLQYDTGGYLARWYEGYLVPSRSTAYGIYLHLGEASHFWLNLGVQALSVTWIVQATLRVFGIMRPLRIAAVVLTLCATTALPVLTSLLLTDIFAGLSVLTLFLLVVHGTQFSRLENLFLFLFTSFAASTHSATLGVLFGLCCAGWILHPWLLARLSVQGLTRGSLTIVVGAGMLLASNFALSGHLAWTPGGSGVAFGRMLQDGFVKRYLDDHCSTENLSLCPYRSELPRTGDDFLWGKSMFNDLGRFNGLGDEMAYIAWRSLIAYPGAQSEAAIKATARQLVSVATGEGSNNFLAHTYGIIERYLPQELAAMRKARQQRWEFDFTAMNLVHVPVALLSEFLLVGILVGTARRRKLDDIALLAGTVALALLGNAFLCGVLSGPHDRYGARMVWIATLKAGSAGKLAGEITTLVAAYQKGFETASNDARAIDVLVNTEMKKVAGEISDNAEAVKQSGIADEQQIERDTEGLIGSTKQLMLMLAVGGVVLGVALAWLVGRGISIPVRKIGDVLLELAKGNKNVDVPYADRGDEVGDNARAAKTFKENLLRIEQIEKQQRLTERETAELRKQDMHRLADDFESAVGNVVNAVSSASAQLESSAATLTRSAARAQEVTTTVAAASEEASTNVQSVASATEELTSSVNEISRQVQDSAKIANEAVAQAQKTNGRIADLAQAANRIGDVVELINTIAGQTNLLALNATIEAARAGKAGRGFAVVASEVKALAEQTAKATGEISQQINGMQAATAESVAAIKEIGTTIAQMSEISSTIAAAVEEQGAATQEISRNVQQAAQGTTQVSCNIVDVQRGASETGSASTQVLTAAQSLSSEAGRLRTEVGKFLNSVRSA